MCTVDEMFDQVARKLDSTLLNSSLHIFYSIITCTRALSVASLTLLNSIRVSDMTA